MGREWDGMGKEGKQAWSARACRRRHRPAPRPRERGTENGERERERERWHPDRPG